MQDLKEFTLSDVIEATALQTMMDDFYKMTGIGVAICDVSGQILVATGWQDICTLYHRVHPETQKYCFESDTKLTENILPGEYKLYRCRNNMWDIATPIIIGGKHLGNLFLGQFFFDDEQPDVELFRQQACKYGFDVKEYLEALSRVPRWSRDTVDTVMNFYTRFTMVVSSLGHTNIQLARALDEKEAILKELRANQSLLSRILHSVPQSIFWKDNKCVYLGCNLNFALTAGLTDPNEIIGKTDYDLPWPEHEAETYRKDDQEVISSGCVKAHIVEPIQQADGTRRWIDTTKLPLTDTNGNSLGVLGVFDDITERKKMEAELKNEMYRLELLNTHMVDRELKMVELKKELAELKKRLG